MTREEAAKLIGVKKKTLDDYIMILRKAASLNYNFEMNATKGVTHLRSFLKNSKKHD